MIKNEEIILEQPSAEIVEKKSLDTLRHLLVGKFALAEIILALRQVLPELEESEAIALIKKGNNHFGISSLFDSPLAQLVVATTGEFILKYPASELFLNSAGDELFLNGVCQDIQKAAFVSLMAMSGEIEETEPIRQWISFAENKSIDYYHYFLGRQRSSKSGFKAGITRVLDLSKFFNNLSLLRGCTVNEFRPGMSEPANFIAGENNLSRSPQPYYEIENENGVGLVSVELMKTKNSIIEATVSLEFISKNNHLAPEILIELAFDINNPEAILNGTISRFVSYEGWTKGCVYKNENLDSASEIPEEFLKDILEAKRNFIFQLKKLGLIE